MNPYIKHLSQQFNKSMRSLVGEDYRNFTYLIALSGGSDSMALADLAIQNNLKIGIAHCNYGLRGSESDGDEKMVKEYFNRHSIPVNVKSFDTKKIASDAKQSIQLTARKLRYDWFDELVSLKGFDFILTGHHFDDKVETFIINLSRGSGLKGLKGIPAINGKIIRPLLSMEKEQLLSYCKILNIPYRDDSSNTDNKYKRNFVRNEALPLLNSEFPAFKENVGVTMNIIGEYYGYVSKRVQQELTNCIEENPYGSKLILSGVNDEALIPFIVRAYMEERNFSMSDIDDMNYALSIRKSGIKLISRENAYAMSDRKKIVFINKQLPETCVTIDVKVGRTHHWFGTLIISKPESTELHVKNNQYLIYSEHDGTQLTVRSRKDGDRIRSLGMNGSIQKLQDVYTNAKLDHLEKLLTPVFIHNGNTIWVPGIKRSETEQSPGNKSVYLIEIDPLK